MFSLSEKKIHKLYAMFKTKAISAYNRKNYNFCLRLITVAAITGYEFYLGYRDNEIESLLEKVSHRIKAFRCDRMVNPDTVVCYDSFSIDNGGLMHQYLHAMIAYGYRIVYVAEKKRIMNHDSVMGNLLRNYHKAEIVVIPERLKPLAKAQFIYNIVMQSGASKLFIHTNPSAAFASCAFYALPPAITKYKINLTDHTFWIGVGFIDYSFEFRPYGCELSCHRRGLNPSQTLLIPFYPIMSRKKFEGFPDAVKDKVVLFSGGAFYKIYDKDDTFFKLSKAILDKCQNVIMLFAGQGDEKVLKEKLKAYQIENRFILIGYRADITEVFEHCDIYINTYPYGGGLMAQYAAQLGKPIVSYHSTGHTLVEELVCQRKRIQLSDESFDGLVKKVKRLADDKTYRDYLGSEIHECVITSDVFNGLFAQSMQTGSNPMAYEKQDSFEEKQMNIQDKLIFENKNVGYQRSVVKELGLPSLWLFPSFFVNAWISIFKNNRVLSVIRNRFMLD